MTLKLLKETWNIFVGLDYAAPEMLQSKPLTISHDYWCLGIMLYEMLVGPTPFECEDKKKTQYFIENLGIYYPDNMEITEETKSLICIKSLI